MTFIERASEVGVSEPTIKSCISILERARIVYFITGGRIKPLPARMKLI